MFVCLGVRACVFHTRVCDERLTRKKEETKEYKPRRRRLLGHARRDKSVCQVPWFWWPPKRERACLFVFREISRLSRQQNAKKNKEERQDELKW